MDPYYSELTKIDNFAGFALISIFPAFNRIPITKKATFETAL